MDEIFIILHGTQMAENTGMAMRAMANTGLKNLRLVSPLHGWPNAKAALASAEKNDLVNVQVFENLTDAVADLQLTCATTARPRNMIHEVLTPEAAAEKIMSLGSSAGIVFGNEKNGLTNEEISNCNFIVEIPSVNFSSYNLAQAVLIICYAVMMSKNGNSRSRQFKTGKTSIATQKQLEYFLNHLETKLADRNYFPPDKKRRLMMQTLRNMFKRTSMTTQEVQSMLGVIEGLSKLT
ncbi:MAG: RNA methyltransferase [Holosporaceae bacterium]|nr:RNA methyltransferase [Holosporaceae bacterium]